MATYAASIPLHEHARREYAAMARLAEASQQECAAAGIPQAILELVKYRASLLNGCSYCIHLHARDARGIGVPEEQLVAAAAWAASDRFDDRERAALALADALTRQSERAGIDPGALTGAVAAFGEAGAAHLVLAATVINAWNRIGVAAGMQPDPAWGAAPATGA